MSRYIFRGSLCGRLCDDCSEPLSGVKVRLYRLRPDQDPTRLAVAAPKTTLAVLDDKQIQAKQAELLGEFEADSAGRFTAEIGDTSSYNGGAFEVDVVCESVPNRRAQYPSRNPVQFSITTVQPQWRERENGLVAAWEYCLPPRFWCFIRALFDAWVICGRVTVCQTDQPAAGIKVVAFDRDWMADDPLGYGLTDADGHFRIDYLGADFRRGTWIDVELIGGPDVYFRVETIGGDVLLSESPDHGRAAGRENVGPCLCVNLCVRKAPVVRRAWFTRVGDFNINSDIDNASGLTNSPQPAAFPNAHGGPGFGFWGSLKLIGDCPTTHPAGGQAMRYRFRARPTGGPAIALPITGAGMVDAVKVGTRPVPWNFGFGIQTYPQDIYVAGAGGYMGPMPAPMPAAPPGPPPGTWGPMPPLVLQPDAQGWVTMPPDATNQGFSGPLLRLNSAALAPGGGASGDGAGNAVTAPRNGIDFEIIYEAEPVTGPQPTGPTLTNTLDRIHINNWYEVAEFTLMQFTGPGADACTGITGELDLKYTMDHELVRDWSLAISTSAAIPGGIPVLPGLGRPVPTPAVPPQPAQTISVRGGYGTVHLDTSDWPKCAYAVAFSRILKLTDGEVDDDGRDPVVALFCTR